MDEHPLQKISISGPTLASLIHRISSSPADSDGLLFGHFSYSTPSTLSDDSSASSSLSSLSATITSFLCPGTPRSVFSFLPSLSSSQHRRHLIGWFSSRRRSPLRPSLHESSLTASLSSDQTLTLPVLNSSGPRMPPCVFLLFSTPPTDSSLMIHTHEYRAYQFRAALDSFEPKPIDIVNMGPGFRGHYGSFSPSSDFPLLPCEWKGSSMMHEDRRVERESGSGIKGLPVEDFRVLMGSRAMEYTTGVENVYEKMLREFDSLARLVEKSSARVLELENHNSKLRAEVAGIRRAEA